MKLMGGFCNQRKSDFFSLIKKQENKNYEFLNKKKLFLSDKKTNKFNVKTSFLKSQPPLKRSNLRFKRG